MLPYTKGSWGSLQRNVTERKRGLPLRAQNLRGCGGPFASEGKPGVAPEAFAAGVALGPVQDALPQAADQNGTSLFSLLF